MSIKRLIELEKQDNIAETLDDDLLAKIAEDVLENVRMDEASRGDWLKKSTKAMDMALQVVDREAEVGKANIKYPQMTTAALQFHSRAYPAIIQGNKVVKAQITGEDKDNEKAKASENMAAFMNWQLLEEQEEWEEDFDKLLLALPVEGCEFKKTYFDPVKGYNVSEWIRPQDFIVNDKTKNLETCPRSTHKLYFYPQQVKEKQLSGTWLDVDLDIDTEDEKNETQQTFYEQHCLLDLDDDDYKEPYYVTIHKESEKIVRIKARFDINDIKADKDKVLKIEPFHHFTKYAFIPSPDGGFYDIGFGQLIGPLSQTIDTILNQLVDAGTLENLGGGFVKKGVTVNGKRGSVKFKIGEFKEIEVPAGGAIGDAIYQMKFGGASGTLFNLLGLLIESVNDITSVQDVMTGKQDNPNEPMGTTLARMEQGMKVFITIYKRIYRSLKKELKKLRRLNGIYLEPEKYFRVIDTGEEQSIKKTDFEDDETDVQLVGDPTLATNMQKIQKAQTLMSLKEDPDIKGEEVIKRFLEALEVPDVESLLVSPEEKAKQPNPGMMELEAKISKMEAETYKNLAQAEKTKVEVDKVRTEIGTMISQMQESFQRLDFDRMNIMLDLLEKVIPDGDYTDEPGGNGPMEGQSGNGGGVQNSQSNAGQLPS